MLCHPADDVTLGDYPDQSAFLIGHRHGSNPIHGEQPDERRNGVVRLDRDDLMTLLLQDRQNLRCHVLISWV
jgi:hypothetical protein